MDNLSHTLVGLALSQAGLRKRSPCATAILIVSANIPDIDIVTLAAGSLSYLENHRGYTHTILFLPLMALLSALLVFALFRRKLPWPEAWLLGCIGVASHLLLDWTNTYGIRLLLPFSSQWFHLDWNNLYDGFFLAVLGISALWPFLANLVGSEIGDRSSNGRVIATAALVCLALFESGRAVLHARVTGQLQAHIYDGEQPLQAAALPDAFNPFRWTGVVETSDAYDIIPTDPAGKPDLLQMQSFPKPEQSAAWSTLKRQELFRFASYFTRFPVWSLVPIGATDGGGTRVDLSDLRFGEPGSGGFHCLARLDKTEHVMWTYFSWTLPSRSTEP